MLIHRIAAQLYTAEALQNVEAGLDAGAVSYTPLDVYKRQHLMCFPSCAGL